MKENMPDADAITSILETINVPCEDNGRRFTNTPRLDRIASLLDGSRYRLLHSGNLCHIYGVERPPERDVVLVSSHVDHCYGEFSMSHPGDGTLLGTFDNSITNAAVLALMQADSLPPGVIVSFTGDEECESAGADDTMAALAGPLERYGNALNMIISTDITAAGFGTFPYTVENYFHGSGQPGETLRFADEGALLRAIATALPGPLHSVHHEEADADEAWQYDEYARNVFSFCLPTAPHADNTGKDAADWMHDDKGVRAIASDLPRYSAALARLCHTFAQPVR